MAKKIKHNPNEPTLDMGFDEMDAVSQQETGPVTVLGMTFPNDEERRAYFREQLRAKLPELRSIEGFPIGSDDDIVNLSDPPYYTACPNPWLNDFIAEWEQEKLQLETEGKRHANVVVNEPYAADVSEGKYHPIYKFHPYLTKVPHKAIQKYLEHYTQKGDIVLDGFCGTGMSGVASRLLDNDIKAICCDLSPLSTFISYSINSSFSADQFKYQSRLLIEQLKATLGWMFKTKHTNGEEADINYVLWSDVFICPNCGGEIVFWNDAVDVENGKILDIFQCGNCHSNLTKNDCEKAVESDFSQLSGTVLHSTKKIPVLINYTYGGKRYTKYFDDEDLETIQKINSLNPPSIFPKEKVYNGDELKRAKRDGIEYFFQYYTRRTLEILAFIKEHLPHPIFNFLITKHAFLNTILYRYTYMNGCWGAGGGPMSGTLYVPSLFKELNIIRQLDDLVDWREKVELNNYDGNVLISTQSSTSLSQIPNESVDYIFIDPPFGSNFSYSELNALSENWLCVKTQSTTECIINTSQNKDFIAYQSIMSECLKEFYRVLKPSKWMTVEFSNTSAAVWNCIQNALSVAGFCVVGVNTLDKKKGSFKAVTTTTAVKQDLIISCFKPSEQLLYKFENEAPETNVWDFIDELLSRLPVHLEHSNKTTAVVERSPKILYDRLISFYVQHGFPVPLNAQEFQAGLRERYAERDGMYFMPSQAVKYDELRKRTDGFQASLFFVDSEQGGIAWLNNELSTPQTYQDLQPKWMQAINGLRKGDILPELMQILEENFIKESDGKWRKPNLQDDVDLAALRHKALMREFKVYVEVAQKPRGKIKEARVEALRAGFKQCYQDKDFATIVAVGDRIPQNLLTEDEQLLQFYEIASSRV